MRFSLLGPMEVAGPSGPIALPGMKPRTLLAALLLGYGRTVPAERLIGVVWGEEPPATARAVVQTYVATLRRAFDAAGLPPVIVSDRNGYRAEIAEDALDVRVFEHLVERGRRAAQSGDHTEAADLFRTGLALWRGAALGGIGEAFLRAEADRLDELRLTVTEERIDADLAMGQGPRLLAELTELVASHPTRERLRGGLMVALYRSGRQADALEVYERGRKALIDELGIDPGPELRQVHEAILRCDPALLPAVASRTPRQLPSPPPDFTGRAAELAELRTTVTPTAVSRSTPRASSSTATRSWPSSRSPSPSISPMVRSTSNCTARRTPRRPPRRSSVASCATSTPRRRRPDHSKSGSPAIGPCSPAAARSSCSTTPRTRPRSGRCCPAARGAR
ncbi:hypothetical protein GCM10027598_36830 [Amycolatopsis oliviviridis]|uniref:OmpR/PhoB-type domain-containing protein n=1 Tax=Amycolatopsis oliviviridis TaxID=1471590 RepID=A0ABQ3LDL1_9PSEU|nr:AfsR/SARP family transcriptional regulator [Amycolatopsis oliviviridis]GHH12920.1 hypothetical protein GCM10017790_25000 [Amycolatopsis oliviviridis]